MNVMGVVRWWLDGRAANVSDPGTQKSVAKEGESTMPKMKTHSGAKKRFKTSGSGKLVRRKQGRNHILEKKSAKRKRRLALEGEISKADLPRINKMLGK